jgi:hypothetical protein
MALLNEKLEALRAKVEAIEKKQVFFVSGMPKSGTTWVERIFDAHPEVVCKGEAHFGIFLEPAIRRAVSTYNARIPKKGNWARHRRENSNSLQTPSFTYNNEDLDCLLAEAAKLMFAKWVESENVKCVGDKTPNNLAYLTLLERIFPGARFVYIIRDVRDIVVSAWFFNLVIDPKVTLDQFGDMKKFSSHIAKVWAQDVSRAKAYGRILNGRYCEIYFENLWHNPQYEVERLFDFLKVSKTRDIIDECLRLTDFSILSKGRARGTENRGSFYRKGIIGDWKNHLDQETIDEINVHCGSLLKEMGYD